jgi:hypothetical protein
MSVDLRTEINDCEASGTTFTTSGGALSTVTLAGQFYEGVAAVEAQHSNNDDELYTTTDSGGTGLNINMADVTTYVILKDALPQTFANRGVQILLGDGTDRIGYSVGGQDAQGIPVGPFFNVYKLDVSEIVAAPGTNFAVYAGSEANLAQTAVTQFGIGTFHNAKAQGNVANLSLDRMTYHANGSYALRINGGTVGTPETMADVQGDDVTNGWGLIANVGRARGERRCLFHGDERAMVLDRRQRRRSRSRSNAFPVPRRRQCHGHDQLRAGQRRHRQHWYSGAI